jgi:hypothetical protein
MHPNHPAKSNFAMTVSTPTSQAYQSGPRVPDYLWDEKSKHFFKLSHD